MTPPVPVDDGASTAPLRPRADTQSSPKSGAFPMPNPPQARERVDVEGLRQLLSEVTAGDLSTAETVDGSAWVECPVCGEGEVEAATYTNIDGVALGVQFFGIGKEFGAHQRLWEATAKALPALLDQSAEIASLKAAVEVARGALEPFAKIVEWAAELGDPIPPGRTIHCLVLGGDGLADMPASDWIATSQALAKLSALNAATLSGETGTQSEPEPLPADAEPPVRFNMQGRCMTRCQADDDDYCEWAGCPQTRDNEPTATGRHCPLDVRGEEP